MLKTKMNLSIAKMAVVLLAISFVACSNPDTKSDKAKTDTTVVKKDTTVIDTSVAPRPLRPGN